MKMTLSRSYPLQQPLPACGHRIAEPVGWRDPDERQDGDDPEVVGERGALVGPVEGAHEQADQARSGRLGPAVQFQVGELNAYDLLNGGNVLMLEPAVAYTDKWSK